MQMCLFLFPPAPSPPVLPVYAHLILVLLLFLLRVFSFLFIHFLLSSPPSYSQFPFCKGFRMRPVRALSPAPGAEAAAEAEAAGGTTVRLGYPAQLVHFKFQLIGDGPLTRPLD